jgi:hypothetical protein
MKVALIAIVAALVMGAAAQGMSSGCYGSCVTKKQMRQARAAIRVVFKGHGADALKVSKCESGYSVRAYNGQYLGLFQMGSSERRTYGHHPSSPWVQAKAAYRYFVATGRDWSPWDPKCRP